MDLGYIFKPIPTGFAGKLYGMGKKARRKRFLDFWLLPLDGWGWYLLDEENMESMVENCKTIRYLTGSIS